MTSHDFASLSWTTVRDLDPDTVVAILPVGAVEAHGPHLPLVTDGVISEAMAAEGAEELRRRGWNAFVLPTLHYTCAAFAESFPGTISLRPETVTATIVDIGRSLASHGFRRLALANSHLDPEHLASLTAAVKALRGEGVEAVFPSLVRKPWALRLSDEFKSGACHAGQYESSVVLAHRPEWVDEDSRRNLAANPSSLSAAIRDGKGSFEEAGGPEAYFGDPAAATAQEGHETTRILGQILAEAVVEALGGRES